MSEHQWTLVHPTRDEWRCSKCRGFAFGAARPKGGICGQRADGKAS